MDYTIKPVRCKLVADGNAIKRVPVDTIRSAADASALFQWYFRREGLPHEQIVCALLNNTNKIVGIVRVSEGGLHGAALQPSDVLRPVLVAGVNTFVLAHNHPSGDPTPSPEDVAITRDLAKAATICGLLFIDHIVVAASGSRSLAEMGFID